LLPYFISEFNFAPKIGWRALVEGGQTSLFPTGGLFTKKFELYFKGSAASAPTRLPRHLYRSPFGLAYFSRARFFRPSGE
jgi:hypothetical protein